MAKLSKGVLGLKFMRKTKDQLDQKTTEQKHRQIFGAGEGEVKSESDKIKPESKIITCPSYLHCERYNYARQSYGGMNPLVEESIRTGDWKMEYEFAESGDEDNATGEKETVPVKKEKGSDESDTSSSNSDDEGPVVGSIIGTIGKKFNKKFKRGFKRPHDDFQEAMDDVTATAPAPKRNKTFKPWKKNSGKYEVNKGS